MTSLEVAARENPVTNEGSIRQNPRDKCPACGSPGPVIYANLSDRQYGVQGEWSLRRCTNSRCGTLFLDPVPIAEDLVRLYARDDYYTHLAVEQTSPTILRTIYQKGVIGYLSRRWGYPRPNDGNLYALLLYLAPLHRFYADRSVMFLPACPGGRLLDIGCGSGQFLLRAKSLGWAAEGVDFDPAAVSRARQYGLQVYLGTLDDQQLASDSYDVITMSHVIEHVPDPLQLLSECHRILKPGGRLAALTPNADSIAHRRFRENWFYFDTPRHLQVFNARGLARLAREAGFASTETTSDCHGAAFNFVNGPIIRRGESIDPNARWSLRTRIKAAAWEVAELALVIMQPLSGEELRLLATKGA